MVITGEKRRKYLLVLRELQKGLGSRQVVATVQALDLQALMSGNPGAWEAGEAPQLHVTVREAEPPLVVRVRDDGCYTWHRVDGGECASPVYSLARSVELVIRTVSTS
jgi:hypothetical protein